MPRQWSQDFKLTPVQAAAKESLRQGMEVGAVLSLSGDIGRGKSTVLADLSREAGGTMLTAFDLLAETSKRHPLALEEGTFYVVMDALEHNNLVIVDDFEILYSVVCCNHSYPRSHWFDAVSLALCRHAAALGRKLIFSNFGALPNPLQQQAFKIGIARFRADDYRALTGNYLPEASRSINFEKVFRFAPKLNAHQLSAACQWLARFEPQIDTEKFIDYLRSQRLTSNIDLEEVQQVDLHDLIGVDDVIRTLEIHIALPLENDQLANELSLRPKRGVLLYGPPGTGKTTVGRALAHRLKGKFFLIDGTFIAGTGDFYARVHHVFEAAKENAPAVIFIDDADAIFEGGEEQGLYRYLLTMLDGLQSESSGRVCVMMTAMEVGHLPLALVRSGRVELWLEMKLPNASARRAILERQVSQVGPILAADNYDSVIAATESFTGADLKRVVEDAKGLLAFDRVSGAPPATSMDYLLRAVEAVALNKRRYAEAEMGARAKPRQGDPFAQMFSHLPDGAFTFNTPWTGTDPEA